MSRRIGAGPRRGKAEPGGHDDAVPERELRFARGEGGRELVEGELAAIHIDEGEATGMLGVGGAHEARDRCRRQLGMLAVSGRQGSPGGDHEAGARQRLSREPGLDQLEGTVGGRGGGLGKRGP